jgi:type I restriction enzyme, S subunit
VSFHRYSSYKSSGVSWLGDVPSHWDITRLKSIARFSGGGTPSRENLTYWNGDIPWVSPKDMKAERISGTEESITEAGLSGSASILQPPGRLLMVVRSGILKHTIPVAINDVAVALNQDMKAVHFEPQRCLTRYFLHWVRGLNDRLLLVWAKQGATVESIEHGYLADTLLPLPPVSEQASIVAFLDRETAKIDALIAEQQRLMELLQEKRQTVISHAVTKGLNPDAPVKPSGIEWLDEIPRHWSVTSFKRLARTGRRTFTDGDWIEAPFITDGGVRLLQTGNVGIGVFKEQGYRFVSDETFRQLSCTEVEAGDVLICRLDGPVGRACLAPALASRMITAVDNAILKVREDVVPEFVVNLLSSKPWLAWIDALCRVGGGFRLRISRSQLAEIQVPLPPFGEQVEIAARLREEIQSCQRLTEEASRVIALLQERRSALISAAVLGAIDTRSAISVEAA